MITFFPAGPHLSMGFNEDEDGRRGGMGVKQLMGEGRRQSLEGQMTNCPVLLSSPLQPAPPLPVAGGTGWAGGVVGSAHLPSLPGSWGSWSPEERNPSPRDVLPGDPKK